MCDLHYKIHMSDEGTAGGALMNKQDVELIRSLFDKADIKVGIEKFNIYIHALVAQFVFSDGGSGVTFPSYREAWLSARSESYKKYLDDVPVGRREVLYELCKYVHDSDGKDFITEITPELFPGNIDSVFNCLGEAPTRRAFIYNLIKLYGLYSYRNYLYSIQYLPCQSRMSVDEVLMHIGALFENWEKANLYNLLIGFANKIKDLWLLAFGLPFAPRKITSTGIAGIKKELTKLGFSDEAALELFYVCKTSHSFDAKKIDDPFSYFRKISLTRVDEESKVSHPSEGKELSSPGQLFFLKEELFNKILNKWKTIDTVDFIRSICFSAYSSNLCAESALAMPYFRRHCNQADSTIVFDANPEFILDVSKMEHINSSAILFVHSSRSLAMIYKQRFPDLNFAYVQFEEGGGASLIAVVVDVSYTGRELRFVARDITEKYNIAIVFARREADRQFGGVVNALAEYIKKYALIYLFCPNSLLDSPERSNRTVLAEKYDYLWIQILPTDLSSAWLKKNIIVCLSRKFEGVTEPIRLLHSDMYDDPYGGTKLICQDPWPVQVPQEQFVCSPKTVNRIWEQFRAKPEKGAPRKTREWKFSQEISLWYSWSNGRGRVQYYGVPTEKQKAINPLSRGKRLTPYYTYSANTVEGAELKFAQAIWESDFRPVIVEDIKKAYRYRPVTLKTFWYCNEEELRNKSGYSVEAAKKLFESQQLSVLLSDGKHSLDTFQAIVDEILVGADKKDQVKIWRTLNAIISLANQTGLFLPNTLSDYVRSMVEKDRGYQQVRKNLAKRSYELEEEIKMLQLLNENLPAQGAFVGAAISFYCGIVNRQICALTWNDYQKLFSGEAAQLWITKTLTANGEVKNLGLDDKNMLRRVPSVEQLSLILDARFEYVKNQLFLKEGTVSTGDIMELPIASKEDLKSRCSPEDIRAAKNKMEAAAGIEPMEVSIAKIGAKVTDLNEYSGDRFRSNFIYRALQTCNMSRAEANYIYGITLPTTFSIHYCDYTNDFSQLMMCRKLERWTSLHQKTESETGMIEKDISGSGRKIKIDSGIYHRSTVELRLEVSKEEIIDDHQELVVRIDDDRGFNLTIRTQEN